MSIKIERLNNTFVEQISNILKTEIKELEDIFEKDYYKSPETFSVQCLYQKKG